MVLWQRPHAGKRSEVPRTLLSDVLEKRCQSLSAVRSFLQNRGCSTECKLCSACAAKDLELLRSKELPSDLGDGEDLRNGHAPAIGCVSARGSF